MNCIEEVNDIIKIEAYPSSGVILSIPFTNERVIAERTVSFSGLPIVVSMKENSAQSKCKRSINASGPVYQNTLSWQTDDSSEATLQQISTLEASPFHFLIHTGDGRRKLIYNWCLYGHCLGEGSVSGEDEEQNIHFYIDSRFPILTLS